MNLSKFFSTAAADTYVQSQLGHASITLTVDTYGKWLPSALVGPAVLRGGLVDAREERRKGVPRQIGLMCIARLSA